MSTLINQTLYSYQENNTSVLKRFFTWTAGQQKNALLWVGLGVAGHGCVITPITLYIVFLTGLHLPLFMMVLAAMAMTLVVNLAALPTKITIPVFLFSIVLDMAAIASALIPLLSSL